MNDEETVPCRLCDGTGRLPKPCELCHGSGWVQESWFTPRDGRHKAASGGTKNKTCPNGCASTLYTFNADLYGSAGSGLTP